MKVTKSYSLAEMKDKYIGQVGTIERNEYENELRAKVSKKVIKWKQDVNQLNNMDAIKINVNKQMDGYSFSISPSIRDIIRKLFPNARPANNIFVGYDTKSDFEVYAGRLESHIYPALLGIDHKADLIQFNEIQFVDTQTGNILHKVNPRDEEV